jgi:hypothetical protein
MKVQIHLTQQSLCLVRMFACLDFGEPLHQLLLHVFTEHFHHITRFEQRFDVCVVLLLVTGIGEGWQQLLKLLQNLDRQIDR